MAELRPGVRLALDWGGARIGVAACDRAGLLAYPVETVDARLPLPRLVDLVAEYQPIEVIVGLPRTLAGDEALSAGQVRRSIAGFSDAVGDLPIRLLDERMTTVTASRRLQRAGKNTRSQRAIIDQAAAVAILELALDVERATGAPAGELLRRAGGVERKDPQQ